MCVLGKKVESVLNDIHDALYKKAKKFLDNNIVKADNFKDLQKAIKDKKIVLAPFCGEASCEDWIKDKTSGATSRNIPFGQKPIKGKCVHCSKEAKFLAYFGKTY